MGRGRGRGARADQRESARDRVALEKAFEDVLIDAPAWADLVVARQSSKEPFHRWLSYRQGFSPELVRRFLAARDPSADRQDVVLPTERPARLVLDPFGGSGTVVTECARRGIPAIGIDAVASLAFVTAARQATPPAKGMFDGTPEDATFEDLYDAAGDDIGARAAVLLAAADSLDGEGHRARSDSVRPRDRVEKLVRIMGEDASNHPLARGFGVICGDARTLPLRDGSVGGVLTSPPYLSRYDYTRVNDLPERLFLGAGRRRRRKRQMRASRATNRAGASSGRRPHPAATEAAACLRDAGRKDEAHAVTGWAADMSTVLHELYRVMADGAPLWVVVAGANVKRVYVPADLIVADAARDAGFELTALQVARTMSAATRRLGDRHGVAPRESIVMAKKTNRKPAVM